MTTRNQSLRIAAYAGLLWAAFQTAMMIYSRNLSPTTTLINVGPIVLFSVGALRSSLLALGGLATYGLWRLVMAYPVITTVVSGNEALPKHWWVALLALPFAVLWIVTATRATGSRRVGNWRT